MTFVFSLTQMLVFLSLYVMVSILLSILVCAATHLFCACLVSVQVSAPWHSWQHTVVHLSLGKVAFEDIPVFGVLLTCKVCKLEEIINLNLRESVFPKFLSNLPKVNLHSQQWNV